MAEKYLKKGNGLLEEASALDAPSGGDDSGKIVALSATGRLNPNFMPTGIGADTHVLEASESLSAGDFVNIWDNGGTPMARKADCSDPAKRCDGFVTDSVESGANATVYFEGRNDQCSGLTGGTIQYLGTLGQSTSTPPTTHNYIQQVLGKAVSPTVVAFEVNTPIKIYNPS